MSFLKYLNPVNDVGMVVGSLGQGLAAGSGAKNNYQATPYGYQAAGFTPGSTGGKSGFQGFINSVITGTPTAAGATPALQQAFQYQDPNAAAYTTAAQGQQALGQQAYGQQQGINTQQNALAQALTQQAGGNGLSVSALQMQQANDAAMRQAGSMQQSAIASGVNPALAAQLAQTAQSNTMQGNAQTAAQGRMQEQLNAQQMLGQALSQQSSQNMQQQSLAAQNALNYYGMGQQGSQFGTQSQMGLQQLLSGNWNTAQGINAGVATGNAATNGQMTGASISALASGGAKMTGG